MTAVTLGFAAMMVSASTALLSKGLASRYPARPLIGVLLALNCLLLLPLAPFVEWHWSPQILALHALSAVLLAVSSVPVWDMFDTGAASATLTAQALSPLAAAVGAAVLLPGSVTAAQVAAAVAVVIGVSWALQGAFAGLGRRGSLWRIAVAAGGVGLLTVVTRMLADLGVGVVETYVVRTGMAATAMLLLIPPRGIPLSGAPRLVVRAISVTSFFVLVILAVQQGSPLMVQTLIALGPLIVLIVESIREGRRPAVRALAGATLAAAGVALVLFL
jgi:drug/metabolite transporter (DMT)-like permease